MVWPENAQGLLGRRYDQIAGDDRIGLAIADPNLMELVRGRCHTNVAQHRAAFLGEAHEIQYRGAARLQVGRHGDQLANRHHARTANAAHQQIIGAGHFRQFGSWNISQLAGEYGAGVNAAGFAQLAAFDGHEAWAETVNAGKVLVAG